MKEGRRRRKKRSSSRMKKKRSKRNTSTSRSSGICRGGVALKLICRLTCWLKADTPRHTQAHTPTHTHSHTHTHSRAQHRQRSKQTNKAVAVFIRAHFAFYQALRIRHVRRPGQAKVPLCVGVSASVCCVQVQLGTALSTGSRKENTHARTHTQHTWSAQWDEQLKMSPICIKSGSFFAWCSLSSLINICVAFYHLQRFLLFFFLLPFSLQLVAVCHRTQQDSRTD